MKRDKKILRPLILLFFVCSSGLAFSQTGTPNTMPNIGNPIPLSPNAASFAKYGEIPVGLYTGIPNISVPIYQIKSGSLQLPINLSYHAAGVRVEEISSWVGLGWSLNAGGSIGRQVRGIADEGSAGYLQDYGIINRYLNGTISNSDLLTYFQNVEAGVQDSQQDMFTYNFLYN